MNDPLDTTIWQKIVNRFGLIGLWFLFVLIWHHGNELVRSAAFWSPRPGWFLDPDKLIFIDYFGWIALVGLILGGVSGHRSYNAFKPEHHKNHGGAAVIVWSMGVLLLCVTCYLATILIQGSSCLTQVDIANAAPEWVLDPSAEGCRETIARVYPALQPFQTGIGATIGLLGLAWSTMYRSVYEDWLKHAAPSAKDAKLGEVGAADQALDALLKANDLDPNRVKIAALLKALNIDPKTLQ